MEFTQESLKFTQNSSFQGQNSTYFLFNSSSTLDSKEIIQGERSKSEMDLLKQYAVEGRMKMQPMYTQQEDQSIITMYNQGIKWAPMAIIINKQYHNSQDIRTGKYLRNRFVNHLQPGLVKRKWTKEEDRIIQEKFQEFGGIWVKISKFLNGRTESQVRNRYNSLQKQKQKKKPDKPQFKLIVNSKRNFQQSIKEELVEDSPGLPSSLSSKNWKPKIIVNEKNTKKENPDPQQSDFESFGTVAEGENNEMELCEEFDILSSKISIESLRFKGLGDRTPSPYLDE